MRFVFGRKQWIRTTFLIGALGAGIATGTCSNENPSDQEEPSGENPETMAPDDPSGGENPDGGSIEGSDDDGTGGSGAEPNPTSVFVPPPPTVNGTETPIINYWPKGVDLGVADPDEPFRALIVFQLRNQSELTSLINDLYDPSSARFRQYLTASEFVSRYAPTTTTVEAVKSWLTSKGFTVERTATNRLLLQYSGTVRQFNAAFNTELHHVRRTATTWRMPALAPLQPLNVPLPLVGQIRRLLMPDYEAESGMLSNDSAPVVTTPPDGVTEKLTPQQIAKAYGMSELYAQGYKGAGMTIGVVGATMFRFSDAQSMWQTFGISRSNPTVVEPMEPMITRDLETTLDIQLAGAVAPEADIIYYGGPNNSDTTLLYVYNEAIGRAKVQVISDSFAHAEASTPYTVSYAYDEVSMMAAALGITVLSASGDSVQVDVPSNSPYVTAVGGTNVELNADNSWMAEQSWGLSGCGVSRLFTTPTWQTGAYAKANNRRAVADVSAVVGPYWVKYLGKWTYADGTSASTPVFAGVVALVNQYRKAKGKPPVGLLNPILYKHSASRAALRDITQIGYGGCATSTGYDLATGLGSPRAAQLAESIP